MTRCCPTCGRPVEAPAMGLTRKQRELLSFIAGYESANRVMPSYDEMAKAMALANKSGIHRMILGLEERGAIRRLPNRARAIEIVRAA